MGRPRSEDYTIGSALRSLLRSHQAEDSDKPPTQTDLAGWLKVSPSTVTEFLKGRKDKPRQNATFPHLAAIGRLFRHPPHRLFDSDSDPFVECHGRLGWRFEGPTFGARERALRVAAAGVAFGEPIDKIRRDVHAVRRSVDPGAAEPSDTDIRRMARAGLRFGLLELELSEGGDEIEDAELARRLEAALGGIVPLGAPRPQVRVVRNLADESVAPDPTSSYLIARTGHRIVREFMEKHSVFTMGLSGGTHVAAFVEQIGPASCPIPDLPATDRRYHIVPLTLEPLSDHGLRLADCVVGQMCWQLGGLMGPGRFRAPSFRVFGSLEDRKIGGLTTDALSHVRAYYDDLDLAVYGCGDRSEDSWIGHALPNLGIESDAIPETDVCLHMLDRHGRSIGLRQNGKRREHIGVGLNELQRVVNSPSRLALLLASGEHKGLPITLVTRAGCVDHLVCDQSAARAALEELES